MNKAAKDYKDAYQYYRSQGLNDKAKKVAKEFEEFQASNAGVDYDVTKSIKNLPKSTMEVGGALAHAVMNPIDTAVAVGQLLGSGVTNTAQLGVDALGIDYDFPYQEKGEQFGGMLADRYGSVDRAQQTLMDDPAGALLDLVSVVAPVAGGAKSAATSVAKNARKGGKTAAVATAVADGAEKTARIANLADPASLLLKAPMALGNKMLGQPISQRIYQSAMKPSTTIPLNTKREMLQTGLDVGALPSVGSVNKVAGQRKDLFNKIDSYEKGVDASVLTPPNDLLKYIPEVRSKYAPPIPLSGQALKSIDDVVEKQLESFANNGGRNLTIEELSRIKRSVYEAVNYDKKLQGRKIDKPSEEALKSLARAAKEAIEEVVPEIKVANKKYGRLAEMQDKLQVPATARTGNKDIVPFGASVKSAAIGSMTDVGGLLTQAAPFLDLGVPKAMLAIAGDRVGKAINSSKAPAGKAALGGRYEEAVLADERERERERLKREIRRED